MFKNKGALILSVVNLGILSAAVVVAVLHGEFTLSVAFVAVWAGLMRLG